jgi:hypothetical protein
MSLVIMHASFAIAEEVIIDEAIIVRTEYEFSEGLSFETQAYTDAPNKESTVYVEYPRFYYGSKEIYDNNGYDDNVYRRVNDLNWLIDNFIFRKTMWFPFREGFDKPYENVLQCAVTLIHEKVISIVFWGVFHNIGQRHDNMIYTLNIELATMRDLDFADMFEVNPDFVDMFFESAQFPTDPDTTPYGNDTDNFVIRMTNLERSAFDFYPDRVSLDSLYYLKPDGVVFILPEGHASGDHFEAFIEYDKLVPFYLDSNPLHD